MGDDLIIASTTDTESEIRAALGRGVETDESEPALSEIDTATGEPVETDSESEKPQEAAPQENVEKAEKEAKTDEKTAESTVKKEPPKKADRRIAELTAQKYTQQRRAERLEAEVAELKASIEAIKTGRAVVQPTETKPPVEVQPKVAQEPKSSDFGTYEEYIKALGEYSARKAATEELNKAKQAAADEATKAAAAEAYQRFEEGRIAAMKRYPDFEAVVQSPEAQALPLTPMMEYTVMTNPLGHDIAYHLAKHPDECDAIAGLPVPEQQFALGRLAARIEAQMKRTPSATAPAPKAKPVSSAPPPVEPVSGHLTTTSSVPDDQMEYQAYKAKRNREEAERRAARR